MLLFIERWKKDGVWRLDFNTSHVTVYRAGGNLCWLVSVDFNTSHVTVYQFLIRCIECWILISIHLMLLFIGELSAEIAALNIFQYISCYCLSLSGVLQTDTTDISIHLMLLFIRNDKASKCCVVHFNTSHVTVYHTFVHFNTPLFVISIHLMLLFIRISAICGCYGYNISIHLMLLFIDTNDPFEVGDTIFQYISCYCLSSQRIPVHDILQISIHLMLLFIYIATLLNYHLHHFNTSHVTVYRNLPPLLPLFWINFNTSHVTVYQRVTRSRRREIFYFNTSHVTVYPR